MPSASEAGYKAGDDNINALQATLERTKADLERYDEDFKRGQELFKQGLIAKQDFEQRKAAYRGPAGGGRGGRFADRPGARAVGAVESRSLPGRSGRSRRTRPISTAYNDILKKHNVVAPIDGLVTYLPVRVGETVVPGVQNSDGKHDHDDRRHVDRHRRSEGG